MGSGYEMSLKKVRDTRYITVENLGFWRNDGMEPIVIGGVCLCFWFARGVCGTSEAVAPWLQRRGRPSSLAFFFSDRPSFSDYA